MVEEAECDSIRYKTGKWVILNRKENIRESYGSRHGGKRLFTGGKKISKETDAGLAREDGRQKERQELAETARSEICIAKPRKIVSCVF